MVVHQNITNLAGYFHFLNVRKIPYVITHMGAIWARIGMAYICDEK